MRRQPWSSSCGGRPMVLRLQIKKCRTCGALGVGPFAVELFPLDDQLYCRSDWKAALEWHSNRLEVTSGIRSMVEFDRAVRLGVRPAKIARVRWEGYIMECAEMAWLAWTNGDRRTFVYYFARAMYAWTLKEIE